MNDQQIKLLDAAKRSAINAYCPYSNFRVGAAVLADGKIFLGANVENASSNLGICAERVAIASAVIAGFKSIEGIAVYCLDAEKTDGKYHESQSMPCGACLQWIAELASNAWIVTNASTTPYSLKMLLPRPFSLKI